MSESSQLKPPEKLQLRQPASFLGHTIKIQTPEPWPEPVEGNALMWDLVRIILKYVVMPEYAAIAIALWIIHTFVFDAFINTPILAITSPEKQCGKTTLLDILFCLVRGSLIAANISAAALFRMIEAYAPTLLIDEGDTFIRGNKELLGMINSGHRKGGTVVRVVGEDNEPRAFNTFCPKAIASIKKLPDTIQDRAVPIELKRRRNDEIVSRFSTAQTEEFEVLSRKIIRWTQDHRDAFLVANPEIPDFLFNRSADNWRPLLVIADEMGPIDDWGVRSRDAAKQLMQASDKDASSISTELLFDIRLIFNAHCLDRISSKDLVAELIAMEDRPWAEWKGGKALSMSQLANMLRAFGITSSSIRLKSGGTPKGYKRDQFIDAWARYLPSVSDASSCCGQPATPDDCGVFYTPEYANETAGCSDVAANSEEGGALYDDDEIPF